MEIKPFDVTDETDEDLMMKSLMKRVKKIQKANADCILCGNDATGVGFHITDKSEKWGAEEGADRILPYPVCEDCLDREDEIEEKLKEEFYEG